MAAVRHSTSDGHAAPRSRAHATRMAPATTNRAPAMRNGGMVSMAMRIARYVEPQMR